MAVQQAVSSRRLKDRIGRTLEVLIDEVNDQGAIARSSADAPEIDGLVYLDEAGDLRPGDLVWVTVTDADEYDLYAVPADAVSG
jgi:ribosomal protein S12 methylthiotransferase